MSVELEKGAGGVGFTLEGGKGSIHGDKPLVINRIFTGMIMPTLYIMISLYLQKKYSQFISLSFHIDHH